jgi:FkbM family methyltransferase
MKSYSQFNQDQIVLKINDYKKNGYFVDIGANDGITGSNTYLLEKEYNWNGICVEPLPDEFDKCNKIRNCICYNYAIYSESNLKLNFVVSDLLSGIEDTHLIKNKKQNFIDPKYFNNNYKGEIIVETKTLTDILEKSNAPKYIDYLSIDVEGAEVHVLKGIDFSKYTFGMIHIEHNWQNYRYEIREILEKNNYLFLNENSCDDIYVCKPNCL